MEDFDMSQGKRICYNKHVSRKRDNPIFDIGPYQPVGRASRARRRAATGHRKAVFADIKKQSLEDPILKAMLKAREAELKYKAQEKQQNEQETVINSDSKL